MDIDIFNDNYEYMGVIDKKLAHQLGLWHRVFTCLVYNPSTQYVYFQLKNSDNYIFDRKSFLDISVGGHYEAGETIEDGIRECQEELGIDVRFNQLISIGIRQTACHIAENYIANEFQHIFLLPLNIDLSELKPKDNEIVGFVEASINDCIDLLQQKINSIQIKKCMRVKENLWEISTDVITLESFPPNYLALDKIIERLLIAAMRQISGENINYIYW
ncbi:NUDIX hydrolase [Acinetobacter calcoaceticus]|uniref:NUDIX hydrolase n=1 Tax=Acinetobacter calcoaceticus TaxID=471 RepID=UPI0002CEADBB|nr:NUDIX domain-containing protein [Acinetobacter calcoaceticus]ENU09788.1 hypothetical protein F997_03237 [Acinetobacter calcoaceticus NIPH 13]